MVVLEGRAGRTVLFCRYFARGQGCDSREREGERGREKTRNNANANNEKKQTRKINEQRQDQETGRKTDRQQSQKQPRNVKNKQETHTRTTQHQLRQTRNTNKQEPTEVRHKRDETNKLTTVNTTQATISERKQNQTHFDYIFAKTRKKYYLWMKDYKQPICGDAYTNVRKLHDSTKTSQQQGWRSFLVSPWRLDHTRGSRQDIHSARVPGSPGRLWMARNQHNH